MTGLVNIPRQELKLRARRLKSWLIEAAVPFWATKARDSNGLFFEYLDLEGQPVKEAIRRLRVQARQIYSYGLAHKLGWYDGADIVTQTWNSMLRYGFMPDEKDGFIHLLNPDLTINNQRRDLYDHAFYLLSCAYARDIIGNEANEIAHQILDILERWVSPNGGFIEGDPATFPRRQNPHMHLFEMAISWSQISNEPIWMKIADKIYDLFTTHFFDAETSTLREFFNDDWSLADGELGQTIEPGHMAEWVWLLWQYERLSGRDTSSYANAMYDRMMVGSDYFLNDEEDISGNIVRETRRLWCQTELIKAHLAQAERGMKGGIHLALGSIDGFSAHYLNDNGTWNDQLNRCNAIVSTTIPTSTFYHIVCMIAEVDRVAATK